MINNLLFINLLLTLTFHDFHVTHTTLFYNENHKSIEITIKVAIENLERSLENQYNEKLKIGTNKEKKISQKLIEKYFNDNLKLLTNKQKIKYQWVGKEISDNLHYIYLYFEIPNFHKKDNLEYIKIENTIFLDSAIDQTNIVLIDIEDKNYNLTFTKDNDTQIIFLNK